MDDFGTANCGQRTMVSELWSANYGNARERGGWRGGDYVGLERL
jgi:hypothetical protein